MSTWYLTNTVKFLVSVNIFSGFCAWCQYLESYKVDLYDDGKIKILSDPNWEAIKKARDVSPYYWWCHPTVKVKPWEKYTGSNNSQNNDS